VSYAFRVVFRLTSDGVLSSKEEFLEFRAERDGSSLRLSAGTKGSSIDNSDRFSVSGRDFAAYGEAERAAECVRHSLLLYAARTRTGVDLGQNSLRAFRMSAYGKALVAEHVGAERVLEDHLGITVYEAEPRPAFVRMNISGKASRPAQALTSDLAASVGKLRFASRKAETAAGVYALSHFVGEAPARFLLLFIALEALLEPSPRSAKVQAHIDVLLGSTNGADLDQEERHAISSSLSFLRTHSISATGRRLAVEALGDRQYDSLRPDAFFAKIYRVRNDLVHRGVMDPEQLHVLVGEVDRFVADIVARQAQQSRIEDLR
jgi:hypothetical protein